MSLRVIEAVMVTKIISLRKRLGFVRYFAIRRFDDDSFAGRDLKGRGMWLNVPRRGTRLIVLSLSRGQKKHK